MSDTQSQEEQTAPPEPPAFRTNRNPFAYLRIYHEEAGKAINGAAKRWEEQEKVNRREPEERESIEKPLKQEIEKLKKHIEDLEAEKARLHGKVIHLTREKTQMSEEIIQLLNSRNPHA